MRAPQELTAILNVPAGAKTMVLNFDGTTHPQTVFSGIRQLVIHVIATPNEVRYSWRQAQGKTSTESSSSHKSTFSFIPAPALKRTFKPALNTWTPLWTGQQEFGPTFTFGYRKRLMIEELTLNVLFTKVSAERINEHLQPPQKP
ncbi:hypothetical protein [Deinococcus fonticola]|uniref:hypothetical protein n=1 Tax=Deinococcus fonticola TaxID=2528713 RepID=UPI001074F642|nr:hypothetical protein [Deinococcus fonticola]